MPHHANGAKVASDLNINSLRLPSGDCNLHGVHQQN
jgi:hypothetical protein